MTYRFMPTGGVTKPISMSTVATIPNHITSVPMYCLVYKRQQHENLRKACEVLSTKWLRFLSSMVAKLPSGEVLR